MNILIAWVLVSWVPAPSPTLQYSPPVATKASCESLQAAIKKIDTYRDLVRYTCVQIEVLK